jgi:hypothetical protein
MGDKKPFICSSRLLSVEMTVSTCHCLLYLEKAESPETTTTAPVDVAVFCVLRRHRGFV